MALPAVLAGLSVPFLAGPALDLSERIGLSDSGQEKRRRRLELLERAGLQEDLIDLQRVLDIEMDQAGALAGIEALGDVGRTFSPAQDVVAFEQVGARAQLESLLDATERRTLGEIQQMRPLTLAEVVVSGGGFR